MKYLKDNKTWELVNLPPGRKAIPNKWVYKMKTNAYRSVEYDQTFSTVARMSTIRILLSIANVGMKLSQIDVSTGFLYGDLDETIFICNKLRAMGINLGEFVV